LSVVVAFSAPLCSLTWSAQTTQLFTSVWLASVWTASRKSSVVSTPV